MNPSALHFSACNRVQTFIVPSTGLYRIEAAGAQGGPGGGPGGRGARIAGTFALKQGDRLCIVVGRRGGAGQRPQHATGGGGGGSFVWKESRTSSRPEYPLLAAGGGGGGDGGDGRAGNEGGAGGGCGGREGCGGQTDSVNFHYSGGGGAGWLTRGESGCLPTRCGGGSHWKGGEGANYGGFFGGDGGFGGGGGGSFFGHGSGGGGGYSGGGGGTENGPGGGGGGSFNAGTDQVNVGGLQLGDGHVTIVSVPTADSSDSRSATQPGRSQAGQRPATSIPAPPARPSHLNAAGFLCDALEHLDRASHTQPSCAAPGDFPQKN